MVLTHSHIYIYTHKHTRTYVYCFVDFRTPAMPQGLPVLGGVGVVLCPRAHMMRWYSEHTEALNFEPSASDDHGNKKAVDTLRFVEAGAAPIFCCQ